MPFREETRRRLYSYRAREEPHRFVRNRSPRSIRDSRHTGCFQPDMQSADQILEDAARDGTIDVSVHSLCR